jgi:hypothetical protein
MFAWKRLAVAGCLFVVGCGSSAVTPPVASAPAAGPSAEGKAFLLAAEPADATAIVDAKASAKSDDDVVVVGRIGGDVNPWVEGRAAFSLVDLSLKACSDIPGDGCPTPWDYCCETDKLGKARTLVKLVGADGKPLASDARQLLGVKELQTLVVKGKAQRDDAGNLTILASGIYIRPGSAAPAAHAEGAHDHDHDDAKPSAEKPADKK